MLIIIWAFSESLFFCWWRVWLSLYKNRRIWECREPRCASGPGVGDMRCAGEQVCVCCGGLFHSHSSSERGGLGRPWVSFSTHQLCHFQWDAWALPASVYLFVPWEKGCFYSERRLRFWAVLWRVRDFFCPHWNTWDVRGLLRWKGLLKKKNNGCSCWPDGFVSSEAVSAEQLCAQRWFGCSSISPCNGNPGRGS